MKLYLLTAAALLFASPAMGLTVPFVEDFSTDTALWVDSSESNFLEHEATGGPDGGSYASATFNFESLAADDQGPVIFRATTPIFEPASGGAFFGDWVAGIVRNFSAQVRHDAPVPLTFFTRFAGPTNFPGAIAIRFEPVFPDTWTEMEFDINGSNPAFVSFEDETFREVFDNIGNVQIGVSVPEALAGVDLDVNFGLDKVAIAIPEPSGLGLACLGMFLCGAGPVRRWSTNR